MARAASPLHAGSVAPTAVVGLRFSAVREPIYRISAADTAASTAPYFLPARVYAISMVFFSWPPWVSYHSIIM